MCRGGHTGAWQGARPVGVPFEIAQEKAPARREEPRHVACNRFVA
jgi:hypothetical protein